LRRHCHPSSDIDPGELTKEHNRSAQSPAGRQKQRIPIPWEPKRLSLKDQAAAFEAIATQRMNAATEPTREKGQVAASKQPGFGFASLNQANQVAILLEGDLTFASGAALLWRSSATSVPRLRRLLWAPGHWLAALACGAAFIAAAAEGCCS
jgi:hypothetical protein